MSQNKKMKTKIIIWIIAILCLMGIAQGALTDGLQYYWNFENGSTTDVMRGQTLTATGSPINSTGFFSSPDRAYNFTTPNRDYHFSEYAVTNFTVCVWAKGDALIGGQQSLLGHTAWNSATPGKVIFSARGAWDGIDDTTISLAAYYCNQGSGVIMQNNSWYHICGVMDGTSGTAQIYINGTLKSSKQAAGCIRTWYVPSIIGSCYQGSACNFNGTIDEVGVWNRTLTNGTGGEIATLYASGLGCQWPFCTSPAGATTDLYITAKDEWNSSSISSFNVNISWSNGTITSHASSGGNVYLSNLSNGGTAYNITFWNATGYFNSVNLSVTLTNATNNTLVGYLHQAEICFNSTAKASGASVTLNNVTIGSTAKTTSPFCFNISSGSYSALAQKTGWYSLNQSVTISALQNNTLTIENMTYANLTISAKDATTNESLSTCNSTIKSINWTAWPGESQSGTFNDSYYLVNGTYNVSVYCAGYALDYTTANVTVLGSTNYTFTLYKTNSVSITILDEIFGTPITDNITIRWTNNATTWENITNTSQLFIYNLTPGNYTLLFYGSNYSTRTYTITVGNLTTQFLTAYMVSSIYSTIFTVKDKDTGDVQADVAFTVYKLVNSTWTTVESKYTDITGKVQIYYDPIGNYRFYLAKSNYEDLIFYLNPILFSTYDVFMEKSSPLNYTVDYDDISIIYSPHSFNNNENTTFNFLISSPDGELTSYSIKLTFPGGVKTASGVNAIGEQLSSVVNMSGATRWDRVQLDYNYTTTLAGTRTFTQYLSINTNATASENTWMANKDRTYGLGIFERVLIVTIIIIFVVGISTMSGQPLPGMVLGMFLFGFMVYIGFIPIWSVLPSIIIGVLFLVWKSGG